MPRDMSRRAISRSTTCLRNLCKMSTHPSNCSIAFEHQPTDAAADAAGYIAFCCTVTCLHYAWASLPVTPKYQHRSVDVKAVIFVTAIFAWRTVYSVLPEAFANLAIALRVVQACFYLAKALSGSEARFDLESSSTALLQQSPPTLFPCRTTHTRLIPSKHSFSYSYLFVSVPILGSLSVNSILSTDPALGRPVTWFSVHAEDYLARGRHVHGLKGKLDDYLTSLSHDPRDYPHAYLVTAPRFLGFSFNPVSFWYLYSDGMELKAMILEVNNTFDERRLYFIPRTTDAESNSRFRGEWRKDFHVSPFNDREGSYSLTATNPFVSSTAEHMVDNNIVLSSQDGKPKLIARVFSTSSGIPAASLNKTQTLRFVFRWCWVGFMTNPRILKEARKLWIRNKLDLFYRPEIERTSIGRNQTVEETAIEPYFLTYLRELSNKSGQSFEYIPAAGPKRGIPVEVAPAGGAANKKSTNVFKVNVLTPEWYSALARSTDMRKTWQRLCFNAAKGEALIYVTDAERMTDIVNGISHSSELISFRDEQFVGRLHTQLLSGQNLLLAILAAVRLRGITSSSAQIQQDDVSFEALVNDYTQSSSEYINYIRTAVTVMLADRLGLGFTSLLRFYGRVMWLMMVLLMSWQCSRLIVQEERLSAAISAKIVFEAYVLHWSGEWARGW